MKTRFFFGSPKTNDDEGTSPCGIALGFALLLWGIIELIKCIF